MGYGRCKRISSLADTQKVGVGTRSVASFAWYYGPAGSSPGLPSTNPGKDSYAANGEVQNVCMKSAPLQLEARGLQEVCDQDRFQ